MLRRSLIAISLLAALVVPTAAHARGDDDGDRREARATGRCSPGASSSLRLRSRDGVIALEFRVRRRARETWRVVVIHERRVAVRATARSGGSGGGFRIRRSLDDLPGPDRVVVRGSGPGGITCEASATLPA